MTYVLRIGIILLFLMVLSCKKNTDSISGIDSSCPRIDWGIVPHPPYNGPVWHPNGEFIGFNYKPLIEIRYPYGRDCYGLQIFDFDSIGFWLINPDGTNMRRILPFELQNPAWSPDGKWIAFVANNQIYKMRFNGSGFDSTSLTQLTFKGRNYSPAWSPDGEWVAYDSNYQSPTGNYIIWKMEKDGSNKTKISKHGTGGIREPNWSKDGKRIIHHRFFENQKEIATMSPNGENIKRITHNMSREGNPKFINNDSKIVFISQLRGKHPNIFVMDSSGNHIKQLTSNGVASSWSGIPFSMSPDDRYVVYTRYDWNDWSYVTGTLWIYDLKTGANHQLTFNNKPGE